MLNASILTLKRGDVVYTDDKVRSSPWGAIKDWKGIQVLEYSLVVSSVILLKSRSGKVSSSNEIVLSGPNLESLIKTDKNWIGYEIISDQNASYIVAKHQDIDGKTDIGPQINMSRADFAHLKKTVSLKIHA
jgi:hypothetical protein